MYMASGTIRDDVARRFHDLFCHDQWNVGVVRMPIQGFLDHKVRPRVQWFPSLGKGKYIADPFGITRRGETFVFFEEFSYAANRGRICWIRLSGNVTPLEQGVAISMPFHLSYPYLFEWDDEVYCVPESFRANEISLYRADRFPDEWHKATTLVPNFPGIDSTLFTHEGRWWIICADAVSGAYDSLSIWYAEEPKGPWKPHARNPMKRGRNGTRPAGTPFVDGGNLYRPSMDSTRTYGRRIVLNRVNRLTPTEFEEQPIGIVEPFTHGPYQDGVHTLSALGGFTLVDGLRVTFERAEYRRAYEAQRTKFAGWLSHHWHSDQ